MRIQADHGPGHDARGDDGDPLPAARQAAAEPRARLRWADSSDDSDDDGASACARDPVGVDADAAERARAKKRAANAQKRARNRRNRHAKLSDEKEIPATINGFLVPCAAEDLQPAVDWLARTFEAIHVTVSDHERTRASATAKNWKRIMKNPELSDQCADAVGTALVGLHKRMADAKLIEIRDGTTFYCSAAYATAFHVLEDANRFVGLPFGGARHRAAKAIISKAARIDMPAPSGDFAASSQRAAIEASSS